MVFLPYLAFYISKANPIYYKHTGFEIIRHNKNYTTGIVKPTFMYKKTGILSNTRFQ